MARPLRIEYPGAFYHITARGNERKAIFHDEKDREQFLFYLAMAQQRYSAVFHIYCLMSNHYHLLLETPLGNLSTIMRYIDGAYTTYYNVKRQRAGHLFQGRYKAIVVDADEYAGELSRYIHLNPVRAKIVTRPEEYKWSSYRSYIGKERSPKWLTVDFILSYFGGRTTAAQKKYRNFVDSLTGKRYESPLKEVVASTILGGIDFIKEIKEKYLSGRGVDRNVPALAELRKTSIEEIKQAVEGVFRGDTNVTRKAALYISHRYSGRTLKEIGKHFQIGESGVTKASRRFYEILEKDKGIKKKVRYICNRLKLSNA
ncbi:MAG: transposase [Thermodesulfovibrionales bacterium]|nr:transposase [Thermodesulfovibrionales bacterium]